MTKEKKRTLAVLAAFAGASFVGTAYAAEWAETHALSDCIQETAWILYGDDCKQLRHEFLTAVE